MRQQATQNPDLRKDVGVFLVGGKAQHGGQIPAQHDGKCAGIRDQGDALDQAAQDCHCFSYRRWVLEVGVEVSDTLTVELRHVRVEQGRRLLDIREHAGQFRLADLQCSDLVLERCPGHAVEDRLNGLIQFPVRAFKFSPLGLDVSTSLDA
ncbi:hypothetical protein ACMDCR_28330 [Labrys okinawensis]|uniref:hypothetical protein n=1 Tax=Labrys okinawensis TaxID=346911 RepID=UPI0039BC5A4A